MFLSVTQVKLASLDQKSLLLLQKSSVQIFVVLESFVYPEIISDHRCVSIQRDFRRRRVITRTRYCLLRCWDFASKPVAQGIILLTVHRIYIVDCTFRRSRGL